MLNSIVWTDRNKSSLVLYTLTEERNPAVLSKLRERALLSLIEMSRWKSPGHAFGPFFILGRVGNISEDEIRKEWDSGKREREDCEARNVNRNLTRLGADLP
ncbi:MAG: hypothetical protein DMF75_18070 [Acidobacteria bacterium]|nr:MAG: hypothetical protein DMF75_18070 [Acidobacteriota bacterium]